MKKVLIFVAIFAMTFTMFAQQQAKTQTVTIQTNGTCAQCKKIMMDNIPQWPGVKECSYDMQTAKVTITYETRGTDVDKLREGIRRVFGRKGEEVVATNIRAFDAGFDRARQNR